MTRVLLVSKKTLTADYSLALPITGNETSDAGKERDLSLNQCQGRFAANELWGCFVAGPQQAHSPHSHHADNYAHC